MILWRSTRGAWRTLSALIVISFVANIVIYLMFRENRLQLKKNNEIVKNTSDKWVSTALKQTTAVPAQKSTKLVESQRNASLAAAQKIEQQVTELSDNYKKINSQHTAVIEGILKELYYNTTPASALWKVAERWVKPRYVVPDYASELGAVLSLLNSAKITKAENGVRGTQLKLQLTLAGGQKAVFKPQQYSRDEVIEGPVYAGKDRHNAEVVGFYLGLLLGFRRSPLVTGRKIDLRKEVMPVATQDLIDTFFQEGSDTCFYGVCYYCSPRDPVCAKGNILEGAVVLWLPSKITLKKHRSPWQRTYKANIPARWEHEMHYCKRVLGSKLYSPKSGSRLLDLVDAAVFDFLMDNGDRHHYEVMNNATDPVVLLLDNGKSFGNPNQDHLDILAPLYQCCMIRETTWQRLQLFSGSVLGPSLQRLLETSAISPVLTDAHYRALDRRLLYVFAAVEVCLRNRDAKTVIVR